MPFRSRKQWRWAFANKKPFARRWAHMRGYHSLPASKDDGAPLHGPGGLLATPGLGRRRWRTKDYSARAGGQIKGNLYRGGDGKFSSGGGGQAARGDQFTKAPKRTAPSRTAAPKGKKGGGGKGRAAAKPKKQTLTPAQKRQQRDAQQAQQRADVMAKLNIAPDGQQALEALRQGQQPDAAALARGGFVEAGMVEQARDGSYRLTSAGRALMSAADAGDAGRAGAAIGGSRDRVQARTDRQQEQTQKRQERAAALAKRAQERAEAQKKRASSGGGSSKQPAAPRVDRAAAREAEREQAQQAAVAASDIGQQGLNDLRAAAETGGVNNRQLESLGLIGADGMTTDQGRRALSALEHGNVRQYQAALQDARAQDARARQAQQRQQVAQARQIEQRAHAHQRRHKSFAVFKDAAGRHRWIARTTTAYRDRDGEILSVDALDRDSQRMTATKQFGPLRWWHVGEPNPLDPMAPWGPGLDIGECDYSVVIGRTRVESGTFKSAAIGAAMARIAGQLEMSPGFFHGVDQPASDGVFNQIRTFERSPVPTRYGRASNLFTGFAVKESRMDVQEMERRFKAMITELQLAPEQAQELAAGLVQTEKAAVAQGIAYKSDDAPPEEITIGGVVYTVKAQPAPEQVETKAEAAPADVAVETQADGDMPMDMAEEDMDADVVGNMAPAEFFAMLDEHLAPVIKMQDMLKAIGDTHAELKGMFGGVATKDDARAQEIATLKAQIDQQQAALKETQAKLDALAGDQPAVTLPADVEAALKSTGPQVPADLDPDRVEVPNDPNRPFAGWGALTWPDLYKQGPGN